MHLVSKFAGQGSSKRTKGRELRHVGDGQCDLGTALTGCMDRGYDKACRRIELEATKAIDSAAEGVLYICGFS